jgi:hypothetical protein
MTKIPKQVIESKTITTADDHGDGGNSTHSPTSVVIVWRKKTHVAPFIALRPVLVAASKHVRFAPSMMLREFSLTPPLSKLEERELYYTKRDIAFFNRENRSLTKAVRLCNRTGDQQARPQVPELRGLENHLSIRANLDAKGRLHSALAAVFIEQARQQATRQGIDHEAIRIASQKVTRQSLDIALYRGQMDHQRSMLPSPPRFGQPTPIVRKAEGGGGGACDAGTTIPRPPGRTRLDEARESSFQPRPPMAAATSHPQQLEQRPGFISQSSLRFRDASQTKDKSPDPPKRVICVTAAPRSPDAVAGEYPVSNAVGKPRRGKIVR